jgi:hypothetical protein
MVVSATGALSLEQVAWALAGSGTWRQRRPSVSPPVRHGAGIAWDEVGGVALLFGGTARHAGGRNGVSDLGDTWIWEGADWTAVAPGLAPSARAFPNVAYDALRQEVLLFGGVADGYRLLSDTWTWNGTVWTQRHVGMAPAAQAGGAMAFDRRRQEVVMFTPRGETWTWDGVSWIKRTPVTSPGARGHAGMVYDQNQSKVRLIGGLSDSGLMGDVWSWDGADWRAEGSHQLPGRAGANAAFEPGGQEVVVFGGAMATVGGLQADETWTTKGQSWSRQANGASPGRRMHASLTADLTRGGLLLFGGTREGVELNDTWTWSA